jgi:undecaprenyl-diphosphatase
VIGRQRPVFPDPLERLTVPGFPSGHTISGLLLYGLLVYIFVPRIASAAGRALLILLGIVVIAWIAISRVFLGSHYPTDVIAGLAVGLAWGGMAYTALELYWQRRRAAQAASRTAG